ncbi:peptidase M14 [bacterium]|nr:peptidase M14 [bacterium]
MRFAAITFILLITPFLGFCDITPPQKFLGHEVGADFKLARWATIIDYFQHVGENSPTVRVEEIGRGTEGSPFIQAVISSPSTLNNLDKHKQNQRWLSHPHEIPSGKREEVIQNAKSVVMICCAIHSTEIASSQMAMQLLYDLATKTDPETQEILDNTIVLLIPAVNPDGIDKVIDWYERSLGKPWEGQGMPWLYQKYTGHDDNRDWFMMTQTETQVLSKVLYHEWYPAILYDIHQMGNQSIRFFVPPFHHPMNPHIDPIITESLKVIGGHMAAALAAENKKGVASSALYDMWWHGGNRTAPYRHNIVGILTEAASARIASPVFQHQSELRGISRGLPDYAQTVNFSQPWPGGWWRLRDIVEYELIANQALLQYAARYREQINRNYLKMGERAIRAGQDKPPHAFIIPMDQWDQPTAYRLLHILHLGGVEIHKAKQDFDVEGHAYPAGTPIIYTAQPYRAHILDLLLPQEYPAGANERPYDMAGWTLSHQMGVETIPVQGPFTVEQEPMLSISTPEGNIFGKLGLYVSKNRTTNDFILLNRCFKNHIKTSYILSPHKIGKQCLPSGSLVFDPQTTTDLETLQTHAKNLGIDLYQCNTTKAETRLIKKPRLGLYQPWLGNMDEGWTRFVLEDFEFDFQVLHNAQIRAGRLKEHCDAILIPDIGTGALINGRDDTRTAPEYAGGIGELGAAHLQEFVREGGTLLCLDSASLFAIQYFDLPVQNALNGKSSKDFYCPGSILRIQLDPTKPIAFGMPERTGAFFRHSHAFTVESEEAINKQKNEKAHFGMDIGVPHIPAVYDKTITLLSGWIRGRQHIQNKAAIVNAPYGKGNIVLYGFRVQHRAQPHGTFRLLFNGIIQAGVNK